MQPDELWQRRFMWLWENATDGFSTPEGWYGHTGDFPTEKELQMIDEYIDGGNDE